MILYPEYFLHWNNTYIVHQRFVFVLQKGYELLIHFNMKSNYIFGIINQFPFQWHQDCPFRSLVAEK